MLFACCQYCNADGSNEQFKLQNNTVFGRDLNPVLGAFWCFLCSQLNLYESASNVVLSCNENRCFVTYYGFLWTVMNDNRAVNTCYGGELDALKVRILL